MTARGAREFFDDVAREYHATAAGMGAHHAITARLIEGALEGRILCVGGLWNRAGLESLPEVTVADLSVEMLAALPHRASGILGDARGLPFASGSFDHVVFPLVLHHITDNRGSAARPGVRGALVEARRVLADGGSIWISEFCVNRAVYATELLLSPLTRMLLGMVDIPLVVMHSARFFDQALAAAGFVDTEVTPIHPPESGPFDWIRPVIGLPWLRVPRFLYPVTPTLIRAKAAGSLPG